MSVNSLIQRSFLMVAAAVVAGIGVTTVGAQSQYDQARYDPDRRDVGLEYSDTASYDLPAFVSAVDGYAELDRAGQSSRDIENVPLEAGDRIRTTRGRAEILFDDGSVFALDEHTAVTFVSATDVELAAGRVRAQWRDRGALSGLTVHSVAGRAIVRAQGDYRITLGESRRGEAEIELAVTRGSAELANELGRTSVREGTRALTTAAYAPSTPYAFSTPRDEFERWTDSLEGDRYGVESVRYLPEELRYYGGVFDRHGAWHRHSTYGWVWYPRVSVGWRPYYGGRWSFVVGFGYSWVGGSRWAWPTHHHGRWDRVGSRYFWIPSRPVQRRVVGYAVPRPSYTATVSYYRRPAYRQSNTAFRGSQPTNRDQQWSVRSPQSSSRSPQSSIRGPQSSIRGSQPPSRNPQSSARSPLVPSRNPESSVRSPQSTVRDPQPGVRTPQARSRSAEPPARSSRPEPQARPTQRESRPSSNAPRTRSAPPATSAPPPPSGSRTPSRSAAPRSGSDNRGQSGTAVRRRGGL